MDAGQRAAEAEGKGQKKRAACGCSTLAGRLTGEADWALIAAVCPQNWPPTLFNTAFCSNKQVDDFSLRH